ncbi:hypothetical protein ACHAXH_007814 [Discostella pseudostelligera]
MINPPFLFVLTTVTLLPWCIALSPLVDGGDKKYGIRNTLHRHDTRRIELRRRRPISTSANAAAAHSTQLYMVEEGRYPSNEPQPSSQQAQTKQLWAEYITPELDVPTVTELEPNYIDDIPPRPKIVVFGASGRIGRRIVKKLLSSGTDVDVVAFVRDSKKLEQVLYDEEDLVLENLVRGGHNDRSGNVVKSSNGPRLKVIVGDLVSRRDVYGRSSETESEKNTLDLWVERAKKHFATMGWKYYNTTSDIKASNDDIDILESGGDEALRDAIVGATVIISCLGTFRPSNIWTDYLRVPVLRIFREDVSKWCSDPTHPYYVNFLTTKKILEEAEREQRRREASLELQNERVMMEEQLRRGRERWIVEKEEKGFESTIAAGLTKKRNDVMSGNRRQVDNYNFDREVAVILPKNGKFPSSRDRIKFIRISHVMVGHSPFRVWNCLTNIFWSQLSRFELLGEMLMESSKLVDTIVLRPGYLTDEERNLNHTSLQLRIDGKVQSPSLVGRDDVADVAVVAALTTTSSTNSRKLNSTNRSEPIVSGGATSSENQSVHHFTWALRWTGQHLSPPQGLRPDGLSNAALCFTDAAQGELKSGERGRMHKARLMSYFGGRELIRLNMWRRRLKPYAHSLAISIPIYVTLGVLTWYLFGQTMTIFWKFQCHMIHKLLRHFN